MRARHVEAVVEREKLHSLQFKTPGHQKSVKALQSLDSRCIKGMNDTQVNLIAVLYEKSSYLHSDIEGVDCEALHSPRVE